MMTGNKKRISSKKIAGFALWCLLLILAAMISAPGVQAGVSEQVQFNPSVKQLPSNEEIFGWVREICNLGYRRPGTEADHKTAQYILDKFKAFGLQNAHLEPIEIPLWSAEKWSLLVNGREIPSFFMFNTYWVREFEGFTAGAKGITAEMVYVGEGAARDFRKIDVKGKIVLADVRFSAMRQSDLLSVAYFGYDPDHTVPQEWQQPNPYSPNNYPDNFYRAAKNGAVGFVGILDDYLDRNTYYNEIYGEECCSMKIPGLWLSKSDGARLTEMFKRSSSLKATLVLDGKITPAKAYNVVGFLPGKTNDIVMIHSHHDAPWASAVEDASGVAEVLALAKYFGQVPAGQREKTLMLVTADTHFSLYQGHNDLIKKIRAQKMNVIIDLAIEHIGKEIVEKDEKPVETGLVEPRGIFITENPYLISLVEQAVVKNRLGRTVLLPTYTPLSVPTDAGDFNRAGFTVISLVSPPIYIYDVIDTPDKVAKDQLNPVATAFADIIESIDQTPSQVVSRHSWIPKYRFQYYRAALAYIYNLMKPSRSKTDNPK